MNYSVKKILAGLIIACLTVSFFTWLFILPLIDKIYQASEEYLENQKTIKILDEQVFLFHKLRKDYLQKQGDLSNVEKIYLPDSETVGFITTLEEIARQTGNLFEIKTASSFSEEEAPFLSLQISLWGDFNSLLEFLANLEDSPYPPYRLTEIDRISIQRIGDQALTDQEINLSSNDLETVLGIKVYME